MTELPFTIRFISQAHHSSLGTELVIYLLSQILNCLVKLMDWLHLLSLGSFVHHSNCRLLSEFGLENS